MFFDELIRVVGVDTLEAMCEWASQKGPHKFAVKNKWKSRVEITVAVVGKVVDRWTFFTVGENEGRVVLFGLGFPQAEVWDILREYPRHHDSLRTVMQFMEK